MSLTDDSLEPCEAEIKLRPGKCKCDLSPEFKQRKLHVAQRRQKTQGFPGCVCLISLWMGLPNFSLDPRQIVGGRSVKIEAFPRFP